MKKSLCKNVRKAEKDPTEKPKIKFNTSCNLRRKAAHPSINAKKDEDELAEFKSSGRERQYNRINT